MENIQGGGDQVANAILGTCIVVGVGLATGGAFITFGTSLWWGTLIATAFCAGAAAGSKLYNTIYN